MSDIMISASTHPVKDKEELFKYIKKIEKSVDMIHCDIMDGVFVKDKTFPPSVVREINSITTLPLDVHLMVINPKELSMPFTLAGANIITVHRECFKNEKKAKKFLKLLKKQCLAGISINPETDVSEIENLLDTVDLVLVMSVVPGKSGQVFIPETLEKVKKLNEKRKQNNYSFKIEVDGGINNSNSDSLIKNGADILVSGNFLYKSEDFKKAVCRLKGKKE